jgi:hypothetical protein
VRGGNGICTFDELTVLRGPDERFEGAGTVGT